MEGVDTETGEGGEQSTAGDPAESFRQNFLKRIHDSEFRSHAVCKVKINGDLHAPLPSSAAELCRDGIL